MVESEQYEGISQGKNLSLLSSSKMVLKGQRFSQKQYREYCDLDIVYKGHKDKKIAYRACTEILKIYVLKGIIKIVTDEKEGNPVKKDRGRPHTIYEALEDLEFDTQHMTIKSKKQKYKCPECHKEMELDSKPIGCPFCMERW